MLSCRLHFSLVSLSSFRWCPKKTPQKNRNSKWQPLGIPIVKKTIAELSNQGLLFVRKIADTLLLQTNQPHFQQIAPQAERSNGTESARSPSVVVIKNRRSNPHYSRRYYPNANRSMRDLPQLILIPAQCEPNNNPHVKDPKQKKSAQTPIQ